MTSKMQKKTLFQHRGSYLEAETVRADGSRHTTTEWNLLDRRASSGRTQATRLGDAHYTVNVLRLDVKRRFRDLLWVMLCIYNIERGEQASQYQHHGCSGRGCSNLHNHHSTDRGSLSEAPSPAQDATGKAGKGFHTTKN